MVLYSESNILPNGFPQLSFNDACVFAGRAAFLLKREPRFGRHEAVFWVLDSRARGRGMADAPSKVVLKRTMKITNDTNARMRRSLVLNITGAVRSWILMTDDGVKYMMNHPIPPAEGAVRDDSMTETEQDQLARFLSRKVMVAYIWRDAIDYFPPALINEWSHPIFAALTEVVMFMASPIFKIVREQGVGRSCYRFPDEIYSVLTRADILTRGIEFPYGVGSVNMSFPGLGNRRTFKWLEEMQAASEDGGPQL